MSESRPCCLFILLALLTTLCSGGENTIFKTVCLMDSFQLFEKSSLITDQLAFIYANGHELTLIAMWNKHSLHALGEYNDKFYLDEYGNLWMQNIRLSDERIYVLAQDTDMKVKLNVLVPPATVCKPIIERVQSRLRAYLNVTCGRPAASVYFHGYNKNQSEIQLLQGMEEGEYKACVEGPALACANRSKETDYCSSFKINAVVEDEDMIPKIYLVQTHITDVSIVLKCQSIGKSTGRFIWRQNGFEINSDVKYSQTDEHLSIRYLKHVDQYDTYTCKVSGSRSESDPYRIKAFGPTFINVRQNVKIVNEHDDLNISCIADCYPLCSVEWNKMDPFSYQKQVLLEADILLLKDVTRYMSGNYSCKVQNLISGAFLEKSFSLDVSYGPDDISFNTSETIIEVDEFDSATILCTTKCFPVCRISWVETYKGTNIQSAELNLVNVSTNGTYTCHATNPNVVKRTLSKSINILVKIDEKLIPTIAIVRQNISSSTVDLQCRSSRVTTGTFLWWVNGYPIQNSDKYSSHSPFLSVRNLTFEDRNNSYTCREPGTHFQSNPFRIKIYGPTFIEVNPKPVVVNEHDALKISCLADCTPFCSWQWFKLHPSSEQRIDFSEDNTLYIINITRKFAGSYSCKVQNIISGAFHESTLSLDVLYGPDDILFNTSNNIIEVEEFDSITIMCSAECFPPCQIGWTEMFTDTVMDSVNLQLYNVKTNGTYTCHATNPNITNNTLSETIIIQVKLDVSLTPRIDIFGFNATDASVVLQCVSSRVSIGWFSWRINGSLITNSDRYSEDGAFLLARRLTIEDQYNSYTCREPGSGFQSETFRIQYYGPDNVVINTSKNETEEYQLVCSAECFPPCQFRWASSYTDTIIEGAELKLGNVTSNSTVTCHATNPIHMNVTVSTTKDIMFNTEDIHRMTSPKYQDQHIKTARMHILSTEYVMFVIFGTVVTGLIVCVLSCLLKKHILRRGLSKVSNNNHSAHSDIDGSNEEATLSQLYWTIGTNTRGEFSTVLERDINMELVELIKPAHADLVQSKEDINASHQNLETFKANVHHLHSGTFEMHSRYLDSARPEANIDPIPPVRIRNSENRDLISSDPVECNDYIHAIPSDPLDVERHIDLIPTHSIKVNEYLDLISPDPVQCNHYKDPVPSDSLDLDGYLNPTSSSFSGHDRSVDLIISHPGEYHAPIPSGIMKSDIYIDTTYTDPVVIDECSDISHSDAMDSDIYIYTITTDPVEIDVCVDTCHSDATEHNV